MFSRSVVLLLSLSVLLVEGDLDSHDAGIQAMSTDKDSTSDEAPTESMNAVSPDQPDQSYSPGSGPTDVSSSSSETVDVPAANQVTGVTAPEPAAAPRSVEEDDEDESDDSDEAEKKRFSSRSAKPQTPAHTNISPAHVIQNPVHLIQSPALPLHPIIPQPKTVGRSRASKRRSRTNRRHI